MNQALKIHHELAEAVLLPTTRVNTARLKKMIRTTLDQYQEQEHIPASKSSWPRMWQSSEESAAAA